MEQQPAEQSKPSQPTFPSDWWGLDPDDAPDLPLTEDEERRRAEASQSAASIFIELIRQSFQDDDEPQE